MTTYKLYSGVVLGDGSTALLRPIRPDDVSVRYEDGLLRIVVPKAATGARDIPID